MADGLGVQPLARIGEDQEFLVALGDGIVECGGLATVLGMTQHRHAWIVQCLSGTGRVLVVAIDGQQHADPAGRIMAVQAAADLAADQVRGVARHDHHRNGGQRMIIVCRRAVCAAGRVRCAGGRRGAGQRCPGIGVRIRRADRSCHRVRPRCGGWCAFCDAGWAGRPAGRWGALQLLQLPAQQPWIAEVRVHHPRRGDDVDQYPEGVHALSQSSLGVSSVRGVRSSSARSLSCPPLPSSCFDSRSTR